MFIVTCPQWQVEEKFLRKSLEIALWLMHYLRFLFVSKSTKECEGFPCMYKQMRSKRRKDERTNPDLVAEESIKKNADLGGFCVDTIPPKGISC
ncbi:hypothetical protein DPMN_020759 [Dreissena polymorpha]|uniref:Uncharacterized protein n=1 Tax=Dreissena polymorpha TaxID=45954 RepID=A0A9D4S9C5_DREPO|nr:hypothetical protein DPMN_020759 [Dreissena polymorpha]